MIFSFPNIPLDHCGETPFEMCYDFLTVRTVQKYFMPLAEIVPAFLDNLTDDELNKEAENDKKIDALCGIVEKLKCLATKVPNQEITVKNLEIFHLNMILRLLQIPSFNGKMKALNEVNKLIGSVLNFKQNAEDEDRLTAIIVDTFFDRPWLDLQQNYVAIAAANYESLAEIISSVRFLYF
ncbi:putative ubiquitin carboxyl-terminal hydrolase FAF-X [Araneus ventricosus]|uniref:Putative ubiquitin carboxyl-terminal hydrolase FAF-X n=1 Tax=Araneus ventricosus TaxID=182803 RepID=A0A4Y2SQR4_ARAVE|nr:putative ubiquitin carboxyl-terminal hydrolase FAF-X [Araneus ventricosus]